jgi:hypothetical protein
MAGWIGRVKGIHFELEAIKVEVSDEDVILVLTNSLPPSYSQFVITLNAMKADEVTLSNLIA